jgi:hypothetical protein
MSRKKKFNQEQAARARAARHPVQPQNQVQMADSIINLSDGEDTPTRDLEINQQSSPPVSLVDSLLQEPEGDSGSEFEKLEGEELLESLCQRGEDKLEIT